MAAAAGGAALTPESTVSLPLNVKIRNYRGKTVVAGYQHIFELSPTAVFIWRQIDGRRTLRDIAEQVAEHYAIDIDTATQDVTELLTELAGHQVVDVRGAEAAD